MTLLGVNIDHVATLRNARGGSEPEPVAAAALAELNGADQITIHLREDRRHIKDRDLALLRQTVRTRLNLEMAVSPEIVAAALAARPDRVTLVPERRQEITTEGGLDCVKHAKEIEKVIEKMRKAGIGVSLFLDPEREQLERNMSALRARVLEIPTEIERETEAIKARFANPQARMFPVAVTFLVPQKLGKDKTT